MKTVIRGLTCLARKAQDGTCEGCAYFRPFTDDPDTGWCDSAEIMNDAVELLKEQESTKTKASAAKPIERVWSKSIEYVCAACSHRVGLRYRNRDIWYFRDDECKNCGRKVNWNASD